MTRANIAAVPAGAIDDSRRTAPHVTIRGLCKSFGDATIYKMELDGTPLGKFGAGGKQLKEFGTVHEIDCRKDNEMYVAEITNWRVQKLTLHPAGKSEVTRSAKK